MFLIKFYLETVKNYRQCLRQDKITGQGFSPVGREKSHWVRPVTSWGLSQNNVFSRVAKKPFLKENTFNFQSVAMFSCLSFGLFWMILLTNTYRNKSSPVSIIWTTWLSRSLYGKNWEGYWDVTSAFLKQHARMYSMTNLLHGILVNYNFQNIFLMR